LPYLNYIFTETSPDRMAAVATLYGMSPRDPRHCRVLEIGCANGANLIAMAAALPEAEFVGIDLSPRQIDDGQKILEVLGFKNVTLRTKSLLDVGADFGRFDYIVCHGVYSWVPAEARDKILAIFATNLEPDGVAYLSYNTYPGWHLRSMARDLLRFHAHGGGDSDARTRVKEARTVLDFVIKASPTPDETYVRVLKDEQEVLENAPDTYIYHEHLEADNHPVYFTELAAAAAAHGLSYLGSSRLDRIEDSVSPQVVEALDALGPDRIRREQYLDFVRNRTFRKSLFCRADCRHHDAPALEAFERLRFAAFSKPETAEPDIRSEAPVEFRSPTNDRLTTTRPAVKAALMALFEKVPRSLTFDELRDEVSLRLGPGLTEDRRSLAEILLKANKANLVSIHVVEPALVSSISERPVASAVARYQAEAEVKISNLRHFTFVLDDFTSLMIRLLDGTRDRKAILATLAQWAAEGYFEVSHDGQAVHGEAELRDGLSAYLDAGLVELLKNGVLVG
jgi:methyltransferase-like protein/cyclopropane fatty-acyl-phospholipid synthase-like methyltransferase